MAKKMRTKAMKRRRRRRIFFIFEVLILLILVGGIFVYAQINKKLDLMQDSDVNMSEVEVNEGVEDVKGYQTIALVGLDNTTQTLYYGNSDTMIIASINNDTKKVKLVSVYRDTYLNVGTDPYGEENTYTKANAAYAYGGAQQLMSMMN